MNPAEQGQRPCSRTCTACVCGGGTQGHNILCALAGAGATGGGGVVSLSAFRPTLAEMRVSPRCKKQNFRRKSGDFGGRISAGRCRDLRRARATPLLACVYCVCVRRCYARGQHSWPLGACVRYWRRWCGGPLGFSADLGRNAGFAALQKAKFPAEKWRFRRSNLGGPLPRFAESKGNALARVRVLRVCAAVLRKGTTQLAPWCVRALLAAVVWSPYRVFERVPRFFLQVVPDEKHALDGWRFRWPWWRYEGGRWLAGVLLVDLSGQLDQVGLFGWLQRLVRRGEA